MVYTVNITKQGQISIPVKLRRFYGKTQSALVYPLERGKLLLEMLPDLLSMRGSLRTKRKVTAKRVRQGFEDYLSKGHLGKSQIFS